MCVCEREKESAVYRVILLLFCSRCYLCGFPLGVSEISMGVVYI